MTAKKNDSASEKKSRVKVGKLRVNKEMVEDLTDKSAEKIKGGAMADTTCTVYYSYCKCPKPNPY
jgi:hypothetical protein